MLYTLLSAEIRSYRNAILYAPIVGDVPEVSPHWWDATPLQTVLPTLRFAFNNKAPLPDNVDSGTIFDLYSERMIALLSEFGIRFETFPALIINRKTNAVLSDTHRIFHLLEKYPAFDHKKSFVNKPMVSLQCMQEPRYLFRDTKHSDLVVIHQELRAVFEEKKITGCHYRPVEDYS
jgi:hypothetical protein